MTDNRWENLFSSLSDEELGLIIDAGIDCGASEDEVRRVTSDVRKKACPKGGITMKHRTKKLVILLAAVILMFGLLAVAGATGIIRLPIRYEKLRESTGLQLSENLRRVVDPEHAADGDLIVANKTVQSDGYTITLEGVIRGSLYREVYNYTAREFGVVDIDPVPVFAGDVDGYYAVVTVTRDDGGAVWTSNTPDDPKRLTPSLINAHTLIHTHYPNMATVYFNKERDLGKPQYYEEDNVLYLFVDVTDVLCYADKGVSVAVYGGYEQYLDPTTALGLDENGAPYFTEAAPTLHAMLQLPIDPSFADANAQKAFEYEHMVVLPDRLPFVFTGKEGELHFADPHWEQYLQDLYGSNSEN